MWFFVAFISIFYAVGFGLLGYSLTSMKRSTEAAAWPAVAGRIVSCDLESNSDGDGTTYEVKVSYSYKVGGRELTNDVLAFGYSGSSGHESHREILEKLKAAKTVEVRYDPDSPETSALSFGFHRSIQFTLAFAVTWLLFVVGFSIIWWVASRSDDVLLRNLVTR
ncbi:MAG: DUF3592 domain-containing protein [Planctomycetota bacterium]